VIDRREVSSLYKRYGHPLYRRCLALLGNEEEARELLQETFCQFWRDRKRFEGRSSVFTYLYRIATNLSIDRLRRRARVGINFEYDDSRDGLTDQGGAEGSAMALGELAMLTEGLEPGCLLVGVLVYFDGYTQEEISASLDVSRRTVGKRLKKFRRHVDKRRTILKTKEIDDALVGVRNGR
tara:strand:- start:36 stop:578 length:543 start_codon:yes stop_codon:yes gene_type:complete